MGASTIDDALYLCMEDLIREDSICPAMARKIYALLQHYSVHKEYPTQLTLPTPHAVTNSINVPLKSKSVKDLPKFSGLLEDWLS